MTNMHTVGSLTLMEYPVAASGGNTSFRENLTRNFYTVSDVTNKFSTDMALLGVGNQIITAGVPTPFSTVPYGISLGS